MTRNWKTLGLAALLAALATSPALAQEKGIPKLTDSEKLDEIHRALTALAGVPGDLVHAKLNIAKLQEDVIRLEKQMKELESRLQQMSGRVAFSPPATGRIRLLNNFTAPMSIRVQPAGQVGRVYRLDPGQTQMLEGQPAGVFTFEVLGVQDPVNRVLGPNETYTIFVYPR